ncbi:hypothetical protein, partial [uncultured Sneathia sp.]
MNINDIKFSFKFKLKLMILTILPLLFYGSIGYADNSKIYIKTQDILTEEEYNNLTNEEKNKYKAIDNGLHYFSIRPSVTDGNINNDGAKKESSMAIGPDAIANETNSLAIGLNAQALYDNSMAIG